MSINKKQIEKSIRDIIIALGEDPNREGLRDTPKRVAKAYAEIFDGVNYTNQEIADMYNVSFKDNDIQEAKLGFGEFVLVKNIRAYSTCEHHIAPMILDIHIAYIPNEKVLGLSKLPRIAKHVAKRLQLQERIGKDIYDVINKITNSEDICVIIEGRHMCVEMRGINETNSTTSTMYCGGSFKTNSDLRRELLTNIRG